MVGLGTLDALAPGPVTGAAGSRELRALDVQVLVPRGRAGHLRDFVVGLEVEGGLKAEGSHRRRNVQGRRED